MKTIYIVTWIDSKGVSRLYCVTNAKNSMDAEKQTKEHIKEHTSPVGEKFNPNTDYMCSQAVNLEYGQVVQID